MEGAGEGQRIMTLVVFLDPFMPEARPTPGLSKYGN